MNSENQIEPPLPQNAASRVLHLCCGRFEALLLLILLCASGSLAYSVLTHEEIVDLLWTDELSPLLLKRFPTLTEDQLKEAHGYAYGGAVIQDLGYYPFGSVEFSNLVHYVRSGDFVRELLLQSQDANEYAFALGALAHYTADIVGHPAVNQAVSIQYSKLRAKYGNSVLEKAECVIVIPSVRKLAFGVGASYGRGAMVCRKGQKFNGSWGAPAMYALEGGSVGFQIGGEATDLILLVMNDKGMESILSSKVKLGADASVAGGPKGRDASADTDAYMRAEILSYSRSRGVFAGVSLEGSILRPDDEASELVYGRAHQSQGNREK